MKKKAPVLVIITGMAVTHLFFTWMVYRENLSLYHNMRLIIDAGYLPVPNAYVLPSLTQFGTALKGAIFYTLTAGIVLPFLVYLAAWAWDRGYRRGKAFLIMLSGFVIFCMVMLNRHGFNPVVTFWFLTVYILVFKLTLYSLDNVRTKLSTGRLITHLAVLAVLGAAWMSAPGVTDVSLSVRDHLLLSNPVGERITAFYYRHSPYPTNAFKQLQKKQLKSCSIEGRVGNKTKQHRLESALLRYDYLPVDVLAETDLAISITDNRLSFSVAGRTVLRTGIDEFLQSPKENLARVSSRSDRNKFTRRFLAFSLMYGLPVFLYACLFSIFQLFFNRLPVPFPGFWLSVAGCIVIGMAALIGIRFMASSDMPVTELKKALLSESPDLRVAALRTISRQNLNPSDYLGDLSAERPHVPERIWLAISLANSTAPETNDLLLRFLDDPHPLVACKAYRSIGQKKYRAAVPAIIEALDTSRNWYIQGYAYNALRTLGWKQTASN